MKKTPKRARRCKNQKVAGPYWMKALAALAAEARVDGGAALQNLLHDAKFDERPQLSLTKRVAA